MSPYLQQLVNRVQAFFMKNILSVIVSEIK